MKKYFTVVLFLILFSAKSQTVTRVIDGDTYIVDFTKTVRLQGVDCPEIEQEYGLEAKNYVSELLLHKKIVLIDLKKDKYNRTISKIYINGQNLTELLIKKGIGWHYSYYHKSYYLAVIEREAIKNKRGLWKHLNPVNPYKFRKHGKIR